MGSVRESMILSLPKESYNLFAISRKNGEWQVNKRMYTFCSNVSETHSRFIPRGIVYSQAAYVTLKKENVFENVTSALFECFNRNKKEV